MKVIDLGLQNFSNKVILSSYSIILILLTALHPGKILAQCPPTQANLQFNPIKSLYCQGDNLTITFVTTDNIINLNWTWGITGMNIFSNGINNEILNIQGLTSGGFITISGVTQDALLNPCNINLTINLNFLAASSPIISAGPDVYLTNELLNVSIGGGPATGGTPPYSYQWSPNTHFVAPTTPNSNPAKVNPIVSTNYTLEVIDANGCSSSDDVVVDSKHTYLELIRGVTEPAKYVINTRRLFFTFFGEYNEQAQLKYKIYDSKRNIRLDYSNINSPILPVRNGANCYILNLSASPANFTGSDSNKFFTLEVLDEKNEVFSLTFKYIH